MTWSSDAEPIRNVGDLRGSSIVVLPGDCACGARGALFSLSAGQLDYFVPVGSDGECTDCFLRRLRRHAAQGWAVGKVQERLLHGRHPAAEELRVDSFGVELLDSSSDEDDRADFQLQRWPLAGYGCHRDGNGSRQGAMVPGSAGSIKATAFTP